MRNLSQEKEHLKLLVMSNLEHYLFIMRGNLNKETQDIIKKVLCNTEKIMDLLASKKLESPPPEKKRKIGF